MGKSLYIGINNKARKVKKMYIGIGNKARKIKKSYIGIGGYARNIFSNKKAELVVNASALYEPKYALCGTITPDYAIFAGGCIGENTWSEIVSADALNKNLIKTVCPKLNIARYYSSATHIGSFALIVGGANRSSSIGNTYYGNIDVYNNNLTKGTSLSLNISVHRPAYVDGINYCMIHCGTTYPGWVATSASVIVSNTIRAYNSSLTVTTLTTSTSVMCMVGSYTDTHTMFFSGVTKKSIQDYNIYAYNTSLSLTRIPLLSTDGTSINNHNLTFGNKAIFIESGKKRMFIINQSCVISRITIDLPTYYNLFTMNGKLYALYDAVYIWNSSYVRTVESGSGLNWANCAQVTFNDYRLVAGGISTNSTIFSTISSIRIS